MIPSADTVFAEFLRRRENGESLDFAALCARHPDLTGALRVLQSLHAGDERRSSDPGETSGWILPLADMGPARAAGAAETSQTIRYCIQCGTQIGASPLCTNPACDEIPNFYLYVPSPERRAAGRLKSSEAPASGGSPSERPAVADQPAGFERRTVPFSVAGPLAVMRSVSPPPAEHFIYPGLTEIGARPPAKIIVDQPQISSRHAVLESRRGTEGRWEVLLTDHGSTNGTFVNGERIQRCQLKDGDRIRLARVEFDFRYVEQG